MNRIPRWERRWAAAFVGLAALAGFGFGRADGQELVPTDDPAHPRVQYSDSLVSLNDRCAVRQGKLSPTYTPVYVNGQPIGFC